MIFIVSFSSAVKALIIFLSPESFPPTEAQASISNNIGDQEDEQYDYQASISNPSSRLLCIVCYLCGSSFMGKAQYGKHMAEYHPSETIDHPYKCSECPKGFFSSQGLKHHMEIHSERPSCVVCNLTFRYSINMKRHVEMSHRLKECRYCKQFVSSIGDDFHLHVRKCATKVHFWWGHWYSNQLAITMI